MSNVLQCFGDGTGRRTGLAPEKAREELHKPPERVEQQKAEIKKGVSHRNLVLESQGQDLCAILQKRFKIKASFMM